MKALLLSIVAILFSPNLEAAQGRGGGDVFICPEEVYLADTYEITKKNKQMYEALVKFATKGQIAEILVSSGSLKHLSASDVVSVYKSLKLKGSKEEIPELDDDNIQNVPQNCTKKQLAVQNVETKEVVYDKNLYSRLSAADRNFFRFHEALIYFGKRLGLVTWDTTPIRNQVRTTAASLSNAEICYEPPEAIQVIKRVLGELPNLETLIIDLFPDPDAEILFYGRLTREVEKDGCVLVGYYQQTCTSQHWSSCTRTLNDVWETLMDQTFRPKLD